MPPRLAAVILPTLALFCMQLGQPFDRLGPAHLPPLLYLGSRSFRYRGAVPYAPLHGALPLCRPISECLHLSATIFVIRSMQSVSDSALAYWLLEIESSLSQPALSSLRPQRTAHPPMSSSIIAPVTMNPFITVPWFHYPPTSE